MPQQTAVPQNHVFAYAPALKIYLDGMESWKENCEKIVQHTEAITNTQSAVLPTYPHAQTVEGWQKMGQVMFKSFVERQIELCSFMGKRWEHYLDLPERVARCKSPGDLLQLQRDFATHLVQDYAEEVAELTKPFAELADSWPVGCTAY